MKLKASGYCVFCGVYFLVGDLIWYTGAVLGLAALASKARIVFVVLRYAGVAYLLYLAFQLWISRPLPLSLEAPDLVERPWRRFAGSLSLTLGNPKPMIFFLALMPAVVRLDSLSLTDYWLLALAIAIILPAVLLAYAIAASRARRLFASARSLRWLNRSASAGMAGAAVAIALE